MCHNDNKHKYLEQLYQALDLNPVMMNSEDAEKLKEYLSDYLDKINKTDDQIKFEMKIAEYFYKNIPKDVILNKTIDSEYLDTVNIQVIHYLESNLSEPSKYKEWIENVTKCHINEIISPTKTKSAFSYQDVINAYEKCEKNLAYLEEYTHLLVMTTIIKY